MSYGWWFLVILVTSLATFWVANLVMRSKRIPLARLADPAPLPGELNPASASSGLWQPVLPGELPRAGLLPLDHLPETGPSGPWLEPFDRTYGGKVHDIHGGPGQDCWCGYIGHDPRPYGPFPVDTGPLLHLSEKDAANIALERDIEAMCAEAEAKIPPRWR